MSKISGIARQYIERNLLTEQQAQDISHEANKEQRSFIMQTLLSGV